MKKLILGSLLLNFSFFKIHAEYPKHQRYPYPQIKADGVYHLFKNKIDKNKVKTVFEIGSRDAKDAIELSRLFRCHVFAFECNPAAIEICKRNIDENPNITLVPMGVWNTSGEMVFYRVMNGNIGASSFFEFNPNARNYPDILKEGLIQEKIVVPTIRLDEFLESQKIENIDLLCMDVQGAAFQVLQSLGASLVKTKYIILELEMHPIYSGEVLYPEVDRFLTDSGFIRVSNAPNPNSLFEDFLYVNRTIL